MRVTRPKRGSRMPVLALEPAEAELVLHLADQVAGLLRSAGGTVDDGTDDDADPSTEAPEHPALARLLPDAYADADDSREFRRFTASDISEQKIANLDRVIGDVGGGRAGRRMIEVELDDVSVGAWLRVLTDMRLVLATRLGIDAEGVITNSDPEAEHLENVYDWLGYLQESLVVAADG